MAGYDEAVFGYPLGLRVVMVALCLVGFLMLGGFCVSSPFVSYGGRSFLLPLIGPSVFGGFAALMFSCLGKLWDKVAVNAQGVRYLPRTGKPIFIA